MTSKIEVQRELGMKKTFLRLSDFNTEVKKQIELGNAFGVYELFEIGEHHTVLETCLEKCYLRQHPNNKNKWSLTNSSFYACDGNSIVKLLGSGSFPIVCQVDWLKETFTELFPITFSGYTKEPIFVTGTTKIIEVPRPESLVPTEKQKMPFPCFIHAYTISKAFASGEVISASDCFTDFCSFIGLPVDINYQGWTQTTMTDICLEKWKKLPFRVFFEDFLGISYRLIWQSQKGLIGMESALRTDIHLDFFVNMKDAHIMGARERWNSASKYFTIDRKLNPEPFTDPFNVNYFSVKQTENGSFLDTGGLSFKIYDTFNSEGFQSFGSLIPYDHYLTFFLSNGLSAHFKFKFHHLSTCSNKKYDLECPCLMNNRASIKSQKGYKEYFGCTIKDGNITHDLSCYNCAVLLSERIRSKVLPGLHLIREKTPTERISHYVTAACNDCYNLVLKHYTENFYEIKAQTTLKTLLRIGNEDIQLHTNCYYALWFCCFYPATLLT